MRIDGTLRREARHARALLLGAGLWAQLWVGAGEAAEAPIMSGRAERSYRRSDQAFVPSYRNAGFDQVASAARIHVAVNAAPSWTREPFRCPPAPGKHGGAVGSFARQAACGSPSRAEAVARTLQAIAAAVRYRRGPDLPTQAAEVLAAGEGHCVGMSSLAVAALGELDIAARVVRGALFDDKTGKLVGHRWIEVYYPDAGWVFSDPTESVNYVTPEHILLAPAGEEGPGYDPASAIPWGLQPAGGSNDILSLDLRPGRAHVLGERRVAPLQYQATVLGRLSPPRQGASVRLLGDGVYWETHALPSGRFSFPGLVPGRYVVEGELDGEPSRLQVSVATAELVEVELRVP